MTEAIPCLVRVGDNVKKNRLIKLDRDKVTIGRSGDVNYAILSNMISRCHAVIKKLEDGKWSITDNKSLNGIFVNGRQLTPFTAYVMEDGDMVQFGVPTAAGIPAEFLYKFHSVLKVRVEKKNCKRLKTDHGDSIDSNIQSVDSQNESEGDDVRKRKVPLSGSSCKSATSDQNMNDTASNTSKEAEYQARLAHMEMLLREKELKQSEVEKELEKERHERENQKKEVEELKIKEQTIFLELQDKQAQLEKEKEELKQKMQADLEANLKEKEETLMSRLADQKQKLLDEKKMVEESLQAEMAKALQEKSQEVEERLMKMKDNLEKVIEKTDNEQKQLEIQLNQTKEENEFAKLQALKAREDVLSNFVDLMEMELQCTICNELFIKATALNCAHVFCKLCINQWMKVKKECPNCRMKITSHMQTIALDSYIEKMVEQLSDDAKEKRKALLEQRKAEQDKFDGTVAGPSNTTRLNFPPAVGSTRGSGNARGRGRGRGNNRGGRGGRGIVEAFTGIQTRGQLSAAAPQPNPVTTTPAVPAPSVVTTPSTSGTSNSEAVSAPIIPVSDTTIVVSDNEGTEEDDEDEEDEAAYYEARMYERSRHRRNYWLESSEEERDSNDEEEDDDEGDLREYYGGYGRCFKCGGRGHWARGCPYG